MGKKCVVSGCLEAASFQWEYGDFLTYTCRTHCIKGDIGTSGRKPMVDERKSSGGFGINCRVFVGVCVFMCLFGVLCNLVEGQHYFIDGLARKLDDLKSFSSISHKFKPELAEIKSLINELKPVNSQKKKNNFNKNRGKHEELVVLTKDEAIRALMSTELSLIKRKKILLESLGIIYEVYKSEILSLTFADNGQDIVYSTKSGLIYQGNLLTTNLTLLRKIDSRVYNILPAPDQTNFLVTGGKKLGILSLSTKELKELGPSHSQWILSLVYSPDNSLIVTGSSDKIVKVWKSSNLDPLFQLKGHTADVWSTVVNQDNSVLFTVGEKGEVFSWDLHSKTIKQSFLGHKGAVYSVLLTKNQENLVTGSADGTIRFWSTKDSSQTGILHHPGLVRKLIIFNQDQTLLSISGKTLKIWDLAELKLITTLSHPSNLISLALSPDQRFLATGDDSNRIWIWELKTSNLVLVLGGNQEEIISVQVSADSSLVAVFEAGLIRIWETSTMKLIEVVTQKSEAVKWEGFLSAEKVLESFK